MGVESIVPNYFGHPRPFLFFSTFTHRQGRNLSVPPCHNAPMHSSSPELPYHPHLVVDLTGMQVTDNSSSSRGNPMLPRLSVMPMTAPQQRTPATPLAIPVPKASRASTSRHRGTSFLFTEIWSNHHRLPSLR